MIVIDPNVTISELENGRILNVKKYKNVVTTRGINFLIQRALRMPLVDDYTNHIISLFRVGNGGSLNPEHEEDIDLSRPLQFLDYTQNITRCDGNTYYDVRPKLTYTNTKSWKVSVIITPNHLISGTIFDEIGLYACSQGEDGHYSNAMLFSRLVIGAPMQVTDTKLAQITWDFGITYVRGDGK